MAHLWGAWKLLVVWGSHCSLANNLVRSGNVTCPEMLLLRPFIMGGERKVTAPGPHGCRAFFKGPLTAPQNRHLAGVTAEQTGWWGEPEPRVRLVRWHLFSKWFQVICIEMTGINWGSEFLNFTTKVEEGWFSLWVQPARRSSAHLQGQDQQIRYVTQEGAGEADPRQGSKWLLPAH